MGVAGREIISIRAWYNRTFNAHGREGVPSEEEVLDAARENGYAWFQKYRGVWNEVRANYLKEMKARTYASRGLGFLEGITARAEAEDVNWLYYH